MFHSLRWRIIFAIGFIILLAVGLSGFLAVWTTRNQFDALVTEDGQDQAAEIAVVLEAQYNVQGSLGDMSNLLSEFGYIFPEELVFEEFEFIEEGEEFEDYFELWDRVVAVELGLSLAEFDDARYTESLVDLAEEQDIEPEALIAAIMRFEQRWLEQDNVINQEDKLFILTDVLYQAQDYVNESPPYSEMEEEWAEENTFFVESLFGDSRIFVTDETGMVLYDSHDDERQGETLADEFLEQGVVLYDWENGISVGHVVVATGEGFYREQEDLFLQSVRQSLFIGGLVAAVLALIVGAIIARQITAPVTALTNAAKRLAQGDDPTPLPVTSKDELGEMSQAFNTLTEALDTQRHLRRRLIGDISHDLNTPLSVIQLEMKALQDGMQSPAEASIQVIQEINLLRSLANDLTMLAETDQGELTLDLELVAMGDFVETAVSRWQAQAESAGISLELNADPNLPALSIDSVRLGQALGNLIDNGLKYSGAGGEILVICGVGSLPDKAGDWVITAVADNGRGIDPEDLPFVFERFYRADRSRQRQSGGRGLGLAIVEQIITLHGGIVWVESQPGQGSTFSYALPIALDEV